MFNQFYSKLPIVPKIKTDNSVNSNDNSIDERLEAIDINIKNNERLNRSFFEDIQKLKSDYVETVIKVEKDFQKNDKELTNLNTKFFNQTNDIDRLLNNVTQVAQSASFSRSLSSIEPRYHQNLSETIYDKKIEGLFNQSHIMTTYVQHFQRQCVDLQEQIITVSKRLENQESQFEYIAKVGYKEHDAEHERDKLAKFLKIKLEDHDRKYQNLAETLKNLNILNQRITEINLDIEKEKEDRIIMETSILKRMADFEEVLDVNVQPRRVTADIFDHFQSQIKIEINRIESKNDATIAEILQKLELSKKKFDFEQRIDNFNNDISNNFGNNDVRSKTDQKFAFILEELKREYLHLNQEARDKATTQNMKIKDIEKRLGELEKKEENNYKEMKQKLYQINNSRILNHKNLKTHLCSVEKKIMVFKQFFDEKIANIKNNYVAMTEKLQSNIFKIIEVDASKFRNQLVAIESSLKIETINILEINKKNIITLLELLEQLKNNINRDLQPIEENKINFENKFEELRLSKIETEIEINKCKAVHMKFLDNLLEEIKENNDGRNQDVVELVEKLQILEKSLHEYEYIDFEEIQIILRKLAEAVILVKKSLSIKIDTVSKSTAEDVFIISKKIENLTGKVLNLTSNV